MTVNLNPTPWVLLQVKESLGSVMDAIRTKFPGL